MSSLNTVMDNSLSAMFMAQAGMSTTSHNIANADTPGYRAKYLDFEKMLGDAVNGSANTQELATTDANHIGADNSVASPKVEELEPADWAIDDNSVYSEREVSRLNANSLMYTSVSRGLSKRLAILKFAASNGR